MNKFIVVALLINSHFAFAGSVGELKEHLDFLSAREMVLSQNLANLDSPNYKPKDLQKRNSISGISVHRTHPGHISFDDGDKYNLILGEISEIKPNGNAVTAEKELAKKNDNAIDFSQTSSTLASVNRMLKLATKGN